eukprot:gb/GECH01002657.1/.p1 GENE.gb/GECH01002657.1/~~gb/GECH01002657.1/.p1  ORF type:complete len:122 (+),score=22.91 gb/GECH01002657.1/:1-366(+)
MRCGLDALIHGVADIALDLLDGKDRHGGHHLILVVRIEEPRRRGHGSDLEYSRHALRDTVEELMREARHDTDAFGLRNEMHETFEGEGTIAAVVHTDHEDEALVAGRETPANDDAAVTTPR